MSTDVGSWNGTFDVTGHRRGRIRVRVRVTDLGTRHWVGVPDSWVVFCFWFGGLVWGFGLGVWFLVFGFGLVFGHVLVFRGTFLIFF